MIAEIGGRYQEQTIEGGYVVASDTQSFGAGGNDIWLIKTDANGNEQWNKTFGGNSDQFVDSIQQTNDRGYIVVGSTESLGSGSSDVYLIKFGPDTIANPGPSMGAYIAQGTDWWYCRAVANAADGTHPCGKANWYIDDQAAGGVWSNNAPGVNGLPGCGGGMGGGFAMLELHSADTLKLSIGYHTLKCDFLGDSKYAPSEWVGRIYVGPRLTPSPTLTPYPTQTPSATPIPSGSCNCYGPDLDCANFAPGQAQACYNYCKSLGLGDVFDLDRDNDGLACET